MITLRPTEIKSLEVIQVLLLTDEDVEEPTYARVLINDTRSRTMKVLFLEDDGSFSDTFTDISYDSIMAHWVGETDVWKIAGVEPPPITNNAEEEYDDDGFVVPDDEKDNPEYSDERRRFDNTWSQWNPDTPEGQRYKDMIDHIEEKYC